MIKILLSFLILLTIFIGHSSAAIAQEELSVMPVKQKTVAFNSQNTSDSFLRLSKPSEQANTDLGPLKDLTGTWVGKGCNMIAVPINNQGKEGFKLEVRPYVETLTFTPVGAPVPNRGFPLNRFVVALEYSQLVTDASKAQPLHAENGMWLLLNQKPGLNQLSVARQPSVPHGDSVLALGGFVNLKGAPTIPNRNGMPIVADKKQLPLGYTDPYIMPQDCKDFDANNLNKPLQDLIKDQDILETVTLDVSTKKSGGISNIPFIQKNADVTSFDSIFWIEKVKDKATGNVFLQLQYSQQTNLKFLHDFTSDDPNALIVWPHVDVSTLLKQ